jgi:hypothetical protein
VRRAGHPARTPIQPGALVVREIPLDAATQAGIVTDPTQLAGKVLAIPSRSASRSTRT